MYDTVLRALRDEAGYWWTTYRRAFRQNFKASILPGILYCVVVTVQIFLVYFCFNMLYHGTNVGVPMWVATVLNLVLFHMLFSYMWPQIVLLDQPLRLTLKNSLNCMIAFLPHALAAALVTILFWGLVILVCWQQIGYMMIIYIAGLQAVPEDMLEAARIDGANRWQTLWRVTIPNVMPSITICMFLSLTNGFKLFDQNLALTDGRPFQQLGNGETIKTTEMLALNIVNAFGTNGGGNRGVGQAKAVIFFIVVAAISIIQLQASRRKEVQQ